MDLENKDWNLFCELMNRYYIDWANDYGERGYCKDNDDRPILFGNWNESETPSYVTHYFEKKGYTLEWSDEWYIDHNRSLAYRTTGDSWFWKPSVIFWECEPFTIDDAEDDPETYFEMMENDPSRCEVFGLDPSDHGYEKINTDEYESGFYGVNDNPESILDQLLEKDPDGVYVFGGLSNEQFRSTFSVYKKIEVQENE